MDTSHRGNGLPAAGAGPPTGIQSSSPSSSRPVLFRTPVPRASTVFARAPENPILAPTPLWWESVAVFNPGVVQDAEGIIHLLYRATGRDGISRLGYAQTRDGVTIKARSREPVFEPEFGNELETFGVEDPRIVFLDGTYYVTYTAASQYRIDDPHPELVPPQEQPWGAGEPWRVRISLALTKDFRSFTRHGVILPDVDNKDGVLFPERVDGQYVLLHRLPPDIWIAYSTDLRDWRGHRAVLRTRPAYWDEQKLGAGAPPLCIDEGWLLLYHGSDHHNVYRAGFVLLDGRDPSRVLGRSEAPALEPLEPYEVGGRVPRVVFPTGVVRRGDTILMYYGAADTVVGVARASLKNVLSSLRS